MRYKEGYGYAIMDDEFRGKIMKHTTNAKEGIAGSVLVMFLAIMTAAWFAYSVLFPQDVLTFLIMIIYFPIVGVIAAVLYRYLRHRI